MADKWESAVRYLFGDYNLTVNPDNKTFSVSNASNSVTSAKDDGLATFLTAHNDIFGHLPIHKVFGRLPSDEILSLDSDKGLLMGNREIIYKHNAYNRDVLYVEKKDNISEENCITDRAIEANIKSIDSTDPLSYRLTNMVCRAVPVLSKEIEIPKSFPNPIDLLEGRSIEGDPKDYRPIEMSEVIFYSTKRGHELGRKFILENRRLIKALKARVYLNKDGIVCVRQIIRH